MTVRLKHNAAISTEVEAKSLVIVHQTDNGEMEVIQDYTEPNSRFITFQLTKLSNVTDIGYNHISAKYLLSFYRQKACDDSNPSLMILGLVSKPEQRHLHEVFYTISISLLFANVLE